MKTLGIALAVLVLVAPVGAGQEPADQVDVDVLLEEFGRPVTEAGFTFVLVHLNDLTTDALFDVPLKYQLRAQARQVTMFYVQGAADQDTELNIDFRVQQGPEHFQARSIDIENFTPGTELSAGDPIRGIIAIEKLFDPRSGTLRVVTGGITTRFEFPPHVVVKLVQAAQGR